MRRSPCDNGAMSERLDRLCQQLADAQALHARDQKVATEFHRRTLAKRAKVKTAEVAFTEAADRLSAATGPTDRVHAAEEKLRCAEERSRLAKELVAMESSHLAARRNVLHRAETVLESAHGILAAAEHEADLAHVDTDYVRGVIARMETELAAGDEDSE